MTKCDLYNLCKNKGNVYCIEKYFSTHFPSFYFEINKIDFPQDFKFSQKLYHYFNDDIQLKLGLCPICGKRCKFVNINIGYCKHCSMKCLGEDNDIKEQRKNTCYKKYGTSNYSKTLECKNKVKLSNLEKFGKDYYTQTDEYKERVKETSQKLYGVDYYTQTEEYSN